MDRKWLAVLAAVAVYCAFLLTFAGCGGGGGGEGGGGSALPVGGLPEYNWSNHFGGGTGITAARGIAVDTEGNIYITELVDHINATFEYDFKGERPAGITGSYEIIATIEGNMNNT
ncbi:MAG TPA: SBBP repeat-containing protein, partial [Smithellaceae bacterium]|nr:SBBP repeat-containing protein [Smithellaceae bacterium]